MKFMWPSSSKPKNLGSVFLEIAPINDPKGIPDYVLITEMKGVA